jgi:hypothetical protein
VTRRPVRVSLTGDGRSLVSRAAAGFEDDVLAMLGLLTQPRLFKTPG